MRTFNPMTAFVFACFVVLAACGGSGGDDTGDDDVTTDAGGQTGCVNPGDPLCPVESIQATCSEVGCVCNDPAYPLECGDNLCWPEGTQCWYDHFVCGDPNDRLRCGETGVTVSCCDGDAVICPADKPTYCRATGVCQTNDADCGNEMCELANRDCTSED